MNWLLIFIPIAFGLEHEHAAPTITFAASALAILPLAALMGKATEALAHYLGPHFGGMLCASMGNAPELIIGIAALNHGLIDMLKSSIAGAIIGNLLFGLGLSMFAGGIKRDTQSFDGRVISIHSALLVLGTLSLIVPSVFHVAADTDRELSLHISVTLLIIYAAGILHILLNERAAVTDSRQTDDDDAALGQRRAADIEGVPGLSIDRVADQEEKPAWRRNTALAVLACVASTLAMLSDILTGSVQPAADAMHLNPVFAGVFLLALIGNIPEYINAYTFARKDQMTLALSINLGATTQLVLLVAPVLVICGAAMELDMNLLFNNFELVAILLSVTVTRTLIANNRTTWFEGLLLMGLYTVLGFGFYYLPKS